MCKDLNAPRLFAMPHSEQRVVFISSVLETFSRFRQIRGEREGGGLLFAEFELPIIRISTVTTPHITDRRWRMLFVPNRILQRRVIKEQFKRGRHFVGEWHTHPEPSPTPSSLDLASMRDAFLKSGHELNCFISAIVGNRADELAICVSVHDGNDFRRLNEVRRL